MFFNFLSILSAYLFVFASAAPSASTDLEKRTFGVTADEITGVIQNLISSCGDISGLLKQHSLSGAAPSDDLLNQLFHLKGAAGDFKGKAGDFDCNAPPPSGLTGLCSHLISSLLDLCVNVLHLVFRVGIKAAHEALECCTEVVLECLDALGEFTKSEHFSFLGGAIEHCSSFIKGIAVQFHILD